MSEQELTEYNTLKAQGWLSLKGGNRKRYKELNLKFKTAEVNTVPTDFVPEPSFLATLNAQTIPASAKPLTQGLSNLQTIARIFGEMTDADDKSKLGNLLGDLSLDSVSPQSVMERAIWCVHDGSSRALIRKYFTNAVN